MFFDDHLERDHILARRSLEAVEIERDVLVGCELDPDIKGGGLLDVADDWVELEIFLALG